MVGLQRDFGQNLCFLDDSHARLEGDIGVIIDFCSIWQKDVQDGVDQRTSEQKACFRECLSEINTPYGHAEVGCWVLNTVPGHVDRKYEDRGWTYFEKSVIDVKGMWDENVQTTVVVDDAFDFSAPVETIMKRFHSPAYDRGAKLVGRGPPQVPERFEQELEIRSQRAQQKGVILFTNGKEDRPLVLKKYRDTFDQLRQAKELSFAGCIWSADQLNTFMHALPSFQGLFKLYLEGTHLGSGGSRKLRAALRGVPTCANIEVTKCGIGPIENLRLFLWWVPRYRRSPEKKGDESGCSLCRHGFYQYCFGEQHDGYLKGDLDDRRPEAARILSHNNHHYVCPGCCWCCCCCCRF